MKRLILISTALFVVIITNGQNLRTECYCSSCKTLINGSNTEDLTFLDNNIDFKQLLSKPWKLDQMYVNEVATADTAFSNVYLAVEFPSTFTWVRTYNGANRGKDYPAKFSFGGNAGSTPENCLLISIDTYHKYYNNKLMDTYSVEYLSNKVLVLTCSQTDSENPSLVNKIEYRFVPKL